MSLVNPMEIGAALREAVAAEWDYQRVAAFNYSRPDLGWPPGSGVPRGEYEAIGLAQHELHVRLYEAKQKLSRLLEAPNV